MHEDEITLRFWYKKIEIKIIKSKEMRKDFYRTS